MISQEKVKNCQLKVKVKHFRLEGCWDLAIRGIPSKRLNPGLLCNRKDL